MSVTALSGDSLDELQARDFSDYAAMVPGLSLTSSQPGLTRLTLRGQNSGGVGSTVAVYMDESPFGSSTALLNGSIITGDFDTWDLQRIEVLRGPQGTLYGANSEGGLLKFVTTAPVLGKFLGRGRSDRRERQSRAAMAAPCAPSSTCRSATSWRCASAAMPGRGRLHR